MVAQEVVQLYAGNPQHPVTRALQPAIEPFSITFARLNDIMDGMEMDLTQSRYLDYTGLRLYCHRVAGVVGILAAGIFGFRNSDTLDYAGKLGLHSSSPTSFAMWARMHERTASTSRWTN